MYKAKAITAPGAVAASQSSSEFQLKMARSAGVACNISAASTPAAKTFVDANADTGSDQITISSHGFKSGLKVRLTTSGVLPGGLALATDYYVILNDGNTIQLASSAANAAAGSATNISSAAGGGTHTVTPETLSASLKLQASVDDGTNWFDLASTAITAAGTYKAAYDFIPFEYIRARVDIEAGELTIGDVYLGASDCE